MNLDNAVDQVDLFSFMKNYLAPDVASCINQDISDIEAVLVQK